VGIEILICLQAEKSTWMHAV